MSDHTPLDTSVLQDVTEALQTVREHLDMDIAYLSEFNGDQIYFRAVSNVEGLEIVSPGDAMPLDQTYCQYVRSGRLPGLINDTHDYPLTQTIPVTQQLPIRSHISVPIERTDGSIYGMFCCLSREPNAGLTPRDLNTVTIFARLASRALNNQLDKNEALAELRRHLEDVIESQSMKTYLQPIVSLSDGRVRAVEALSRFRVSQSHPLAAAPNIEWWFEQARTAQMQVPFEINAIKIALAHMHHLPKKVYLSVNVSPATLSSPRFRECLAHVPRDRLFVELTEHVEIAQTKELLDQLDWLRERGIGVAIDDVGAGFAGLSTIVKLRPNVLKLDRSLVTDIDSDVGKQALTRAMYHFADSVSAFLIAEGVETAKEHHALRQIGVRLGQGYLYSRPASAFDQIDAIVAESAVTMPEAQASLSAALHHNASNERMSA